MVSFSEIISQLLIRHNCVIVPDFGGFVARTTVSEIDEIRGIITPPKKAILFNQQLLLSDGLLISEYALTNSLSFTESQSKIDGIVQLWKSELKQGKTISITKVGDLSLNEQGNLCFEQDRFFNLLLNSYGLGNVKFVPSIEKSQPLKEESTIKFETKEPIQKTLIERAEEDVDLSIIQHPAISSKTKKWKVALAAACILPLAFYSVWLPTQTDVLESKILSFTDFNPFKTSPEATYRSSNILKGEEIFTDITLEEQIQQLDPSANSFSYEFDDTFYLTIPLNKKPEEVNSPIETIPTNSQVNPTVLINQNPTATQNNSTPSADIQFNGVKPGLKYAIVGCFSEEQNARNYVNELSNKGFNAKFLDFNNGLYRISIDESTTIDSLQNTIQKASSQGYNTWILK